MHSGHRQPVLGAGGSQGHRHGGLRFFAQLQIKIPARGWLIKQIAPQPPARLLRLLDLRRTPCEQFLPRSALLLRRHVQQAVPHKPAGAHGYRGVVGDDKIQHDPDKVPGFGYLTGKDATLRAVHTQVQFDRVNHVVTARAGAQKRMQAIPAGGKHQRRLNLKQGTFMALPQVNEIGFAGRPGVRQRQIRLLGRGNDRQRQLNGTRRRAENRNRDQPNQ